jgi:hypothetical protein
MTKTSRRGFIATLLAGVGLAKYAKPPMVHLSELAEWPADDPRIKMKVISRELVGGISITPALLEMVSVPMLNFHETHAEYLQLLKDHSIDYWRPWWEK